MWKVSTFGFFLVRIQSECEKIRTRITPNADSFRAVTSAILSGDYPLSKHVTIQWSFRDEILSRWFHEMKLFRETTFPCSVSVNSIYITKNSSLFSQNKGLELHGCFHVNLLHILRTPFSKNTSEGLLL